MSEVEVFDEAVDASWRVFRSALADHLATMSADDIFIVGAASADYSKLAVTLDYWLAQDHLVCFARVDGLAGNRDLLDLARTGDWRPVGTDEPDTVHLGIPQRLADLAAVKAVAMLRDVAGIPHPSFVHARTSAGPLALTPAMADVPEEPAPMVLPELDHPTNPSELHEAVARALAWKFGSPPVTDEDNDFPVILDGFAGYVLPHAKEPQVRILVPLLRDVTGRTRAAEVLADLNSQLAFIRLTLTADQVNAVIDVPGLPFSHEQFGDHLDRMTTFLRGLDDQFAHRLGGRFCDESRATEPEAAFPDHECEPDLPSGLLTLIQLDPDGIGALNAEQVADVCGRDRDTILEYLRISEEQVVEWRGNTVLAYESDDADDDEREMCEDEAAGWQQTVDSLRAALRFVTLGAPRRPRQTELFDLEPDQPDLFD
ncbi:T3SS (YopN, CesT) and YbjN peptide-binding chaperone 1 [Rhodococcus sp. NPDC004095]